MTSARSITGEGVSSADLVEALPDDGESVIALDGTTLDAAQIDAARAALGRELPDELTRPDPSAGRSARPPRPRSGASSAPRSPVP